MASQQQNSFLVNQLLLGKVNINEILNRNQFENEESSQQLNVNRPRSSISWISCSNIAETSQSFEEEENSPGPSRPMTPQSFEKLEKEFDLEEFIAELKKHAVFVEHFIDIIQRPDSEIKCLE